MCGRYAIKTPGRAMERLFGRLGELPNFPPHYNAAPSQPLPIVRRRERGAMRGERELVLARWGLVPSWSKGPDSRFSMINARAETVTAKPAYRGAFRHRRCLVPASGFFEWQARPGGKQPWYFTTASGEDVAFAGLWEHWIGPAGDEIEFFAIIVTEANRLVAPVHDRMPVILKPEAYARWLGEEDAIPGVLERMLVPYPAEEMAAWPVSPRVGSTDCDEPFLIEPCQADNRTGLLL